MIYDWVMSAKMRVTRSDSEIEAFQTNYRQLRSGIVLGFWDQAELDEARRKAGLDD